MNQAIKLLRTFILLSLLVWSWFYIYGQKVIQPPVDVLQDLYNYYQTWTHTTLWEYQTDIDQLIRVKQAYLDDFLYAETIQYYLSGTYADTIDKTVLKKLNMIDNVIEDIENKMKLVKVPFYIYREQEMKKIEEKEVDLK